MIVIDASVLANVIGDGADGKRARAEVRMAQDLAAPDLVDVATVAVLRKRWLAEAITQRRFASAIGDLENIAIDRYPTLPLMRRAYELRSTVTSYDTAYVALSEILGCELLTGDARLAKALGPKCSLHNSERLLYPGSPATLAVRTAHAGWTGIGPTAWVATI